MKNKGDPLLKEEEPFGFSGKICEIILSFPQTGALQRDLDYVPARLGMMGCHSYSIRIFEVHDGFKG